MKETRRYVARAGVLGEQEFARETVRLVKQGRASVHAVRFGGQV